MKLIIIVSHSVKKQNLVLLKWVFYVQVKAAAVHSWTGKATGQVSGVMPPNTSLLFVNSRLQVRSLTFKNLIFFFTCMFFKIETRWLFSYLERTECVDAYSNCEDKIKLEPGACKEYPEFAWQSCPSTCGICGTKGSVMHETSSIHRKRNPIVIDYLYLEYSTLIFCTYLIINPFF